MTEQHFQGLLSDYSLFGNPNSRHDNSQTQSNSNSNSNSNSVTTSKGSHNVTPKVLLSCELCRQRKVKCERLHPDLALVQRAAAIYPRVRALIYLRLMTVL